MSIQGSSADAGPTRCPDCGSELNYTIPGFRPANQIERSRLTAETIRLLGLCANPWCPGKLHLGPSKTANPGP